LRNLCKTGMNATKKFILFWSSPVQQVGNRTKIYNATGCHNRTKVLCQRADDTGARTNRLQSLRARTTYAWARESNVWSFETRGIQYCIGTHCWTGLSKWDVFTCWSVKKSSPSMANGDKWVSGEKPEIFRGAGFVPNLNHSLSQFN